MIEQNSRRTKVIKSFEGTALTAAEAERVLQEEVDVLRLVYKPEHVLALLNFISICRKKPDDPSTLPIMLDVSSWTQGVIFGLKSTLDLSFGERVTASPVGGDGQFQIRTDEPWTTLFVQDATVFFGSGTICLRVVTVGPALVELEVLQGGAVYPDTDIVIPQTRRDPELSEVGVDQLEPLIDTGIDYLIIPGQWTTARIAEFHGELARKYGEGAPWLISKIDSGDAYERLESIIPLVQGVLISRRELALTVNPATVPMITKEIIQLCNDHACIVATASEMLASMRRNATPTRAEVSDVANAVIDGTDAVVLSEEVANGKYGAHAVTIMHRIIRDIELGQGVKPNWVRVTPAVNTVMDAIAYNAFRTADRIKAKAIVCITKAGNTALKLASYRPPVPIIAVTFDSAVQRRLAAVRGVESLLLDIDPNLDEVLPLVNDRLVRGSWLKPGDAIIFVSITLSPVGRESSNLFTVQTLS